MGMMGMMGMGMGIDMDSGRGADIGPVARIWYEDGLAMIRRVCM